MEDPLLTLEVLGPYTLTTHIRDSAVFEHPSGAAMQWVALGDGVIDFRQFFDKFRQLCPNAVAHLEILTGSAARVIPYFDPEFWKAFPTAKASDFARFVALARKNYFDGIAFHRVVPNFVVQGGDPRGDGNGGPGYQIRCEINTAPYARGAVGMALSGKDTGGSQFFVTHSPQPHLDGGYTVFARVTAGMDVVDRLARGDRILSVNIIE